MRPLSVTPKGLIGTIFLFAVAAVCVRLGFWQLDRLEQREARNAAVRARMSAPPIELDGPVADTAGLAYRAVTVRGRLDYARSIILAGKSRRGMPGVHVLTPLKLAGSRAAVLVNRGYLPAPDAASARLERLERRPGTVEIQGLLLAVPDQEAKLPTDDGAVGAGFRRTWYRFDIDALRAQYPYPILDLYVRALPAPGAPERPARLELPELSDGPHLEYAIQWFSFAAIALVGWAALVMRRGGREREPQPRPSAGR